MTREKEAGIITEVEEYIKNCKGIIKFYLDAKKPISNSQQHVKKKLKIILWVDKDIFESNEVISNLAGEKTFKENITLILHGLLVPVYDIYYV